MVVLALVACTPVPAGVEPSELPPVLRAQRPADVLATVGQRVRVAVLGGPAVDGGWVRFETSTAGGSRGSSGQRELEAGEAGEWIAEIPAQATGTEVSYHFELRLAGGAVVRHPARVPAEYRYRVLPMRLEGVIVPWRGGSRLGDEPVRARLWGASAPRATLVGRRSGGGEVRVPMRAVPVADGSHLLEAPLPALEPGQLLDFHLEARDGDQVIVWPEGAPVFSVSLKRSLLAVSPVAPGEGRILDLASGHDARWVALEGAGLRQVGAGGAASGTWTVGSGLPSAVVRHVELDEVSGRVHVGTDRGVVSIDTRTGVAVAVAVERAGGSGIGGEADLAGWEADPVVVSPLDGSLHFQLRGEPPPGQSRTSTQWLLHRGRLSRWHPTGGAVEWTAGAFDPVDGCFLFAGSTSSARPGSALVVHRVCGGAEESWRLAGLPGALSFARLLGVAAVAREPVSGRVVLAVTAEENRRGAPRRLHGLLRLNEEDGTLEPLGELPFPTEITALAADDLHGRLLVGTAGDGVLAWRQGGLAPFAADPRVATVTALEADPRRGSLTAATPRGLVRLRADGTAETDLVLPPEPGLALDALPMAVAAQGPRVLFSSHRAGLAELVRRPDASWFLARRWLAGDEIPVGSYGPAVYEAGGGIAVILRSRGIVRIGEEGWALLSTDAGLAAPDLLNLLALRSGVLLAAVGTSPFAPAGEADLQVIEGNRVSASYRFGERRGGAIGDLLEMADRGTVWAATAMGVFEVGRDGSPQRLSQYATTALAREPRTGAVGAVGSTVERWEGERFVPVLFRIDHPRAVGGGYAPGHPVDLAIDSAGRWVLLYSNGAIVLLDASGNFLGVLDAEDGIPATSRRLLAVPAAREVLVGSGHEGTVSLADPLP